MLHFVIVCLLTEEAIVLLYILRWEVELQRSNASFIMIYASDRNRTYAFKQYTVSRSYILSNDGVLEAMQMETSYIVVEVHVKGVLYTY